jgi:hypothetical protein
MEIMLKNKDGFQVNISLSIFFIAFCDLFTDFPSYVQIQSSHMYESLVIGITQLWSNQGTK